MKERFFEILANLDVEGLKDFLKQNPDFDITVKEEFETAQDPPPSMPNYMYIGYGLLKSSMSKSLNENDLGEISDTEGEEKAKEILKLLATRDPNYLYIRDPAHSYTLLSLFLNHSKDCVAWFVAEFKVADILLTMHDKDNNSLAQELFKNSIPVINHIKDEEILKQLVRLKAIDLNAQDANGESILHKDIALNSPGLFEYLLDKGAKLLPNNKGKNPYDIAKEKGKNRISELILAPLLYKFTQELLIASTPYQNLSSKITEQEYKVLIDFYGAKRFVELLKYGNIKSIFQRSDCADIMKVVLDNIQYTNCGSLDDLKNWSFKEYAQNLNYNKMKLLIEYGIDEITLNQALFLAVSNQALECVEFLIANGADVDAVYVYGHIPPIVKACENGNFKIAKLLIDNGANVNARDKSHDTALHYACMNSRLGAAKLLIDSGADVNAREDHDLTALILACRNGNFKIAKLLIDNGADVNARAKSYRYVEGLSDSPLLAACKVNNTKLAKFLIERGADVNVKNKDNRATPLSLAKKNKNQELIKLIEPLSNDFTSVLKRFFSKIFTAIFKSKSKNEASVAHVAFNTNEAEVKIAENVIRDMTATKKEVSADKAK